MGLAAAQTILCVTTRYVLFLLTQLCEILDDRNILYCFTLAGIFARILFSCHLAVVAFGTYRQDLLACRPGQLRR